MTQPLNAAGPAEATRQAPAQPAGAVPVITIDGPTASGKGTIASHVAARLGWHYLDSGALYRLCALESIERSVDPADDIRLTSLAERLAPRFEGATILLGGRDVTLNIRSEAVGSLASRIAVLPGLRAALLTLQRGFRQPPGLVADGRDMGTVVFPDAALKVFLTATVESRAQRRTKQLIEKGFSANLADLLRDLGQRDARDTQRVHSPLKPAQEAFVLDSTLLTIEETVAVVIAEYERRKL